MLATPITLRIGAEQSRAGTTEWNSGSLAARPAPENLSKDCVLRKKLKINNQLSAFCEDGLHVFEMLHMLEVQCSKALYGQSPLHVRGHLMDVVVRMCPC